MVHFEDIEENGRPFLRVTTGLTTRAEDDDHKFPVRPSMLRSPSSSTIEEMRLEFPKEMTKYIRMERPGYILQSCMANKEHILGDERPPLLGRKIIEGSKRWGGATLKLCGEAKFIPLFWEWTEDIIRRCSRQLKAVEIHDAVYASLYTYDREPNIIRAFCEGWCPWTNTLHTEIGEWSLSLWDLYQLGGLPIMGRKYDEAVPSFAVMEACERDGARRLSKACEHLFAAHCMLADELTEPSGVPAAMWIQFWCKRSEVYKDLPRKQSTRPKNAPTLNPKGILEEEPVVWSAEELSLFSTLGITGAAEMEITYLAAFLSCWLCVFVLPVHEKKVIRPTIFEVATKMASGTRFSLAPTVLAHIYHGLNVVANGDKPSQPNFLFPAHYLYAWIAHYFDTHLQLDAVPPGPLMVRYSGHRGAKYYTDVAAPELIHTGASSSHIVLCWRNRSVIIFVRMALWASPKSAMSSRFALHTSLCDLMRSSFSSLIIRRISAGNLASVKMSLARLAES